jgi:hypothetical protein
VTSVPTQHVEQVLKVWRRRRFVFDALRRSGM